MKDQNKELTYEAALAVLEKNLNLLENPETSLDNALRIFEESSELLKFCKKKLSDTESKLAKILENEDVEVPFEA